MTDITEAHERATASGSEAQFQYWLPDGKPPREGGTRAEAGLVFSAAYLRALGDAGHGKATVDEIVAAVSARPGVRSR